MEGDMIPHCAESVTTGRAWVNPQPSQLAKGGRCPYPATMTSAHGTGTAPAIELSDQQLTDYQRDGFVVVEDLVSAGELSALQERLHEYTHGGRSQEQIRVQTEPRVTRGELRVEHPGDGIRKIDGLVESDDLFQALGRLPNVVAVLTRFLGPDIKMFRNAVLLKAPEVGSAKGMHQDSPYWPIRPMELCSCWFAIDEATTENGCMGVIAGAHRKGALPHVHVTDDYVVAPEHHADAAKTLVPMPAGAGLFFHSLLPHATEPNLSNTWRRAIALSYMSARSTHTDPAGGPVYFPIAGVSHPGCVR